MMRISFSMDDIKDITLLYSYAKEENQEFGEGYVEEYHGEQYCKKIITDVINFLGNSEWKEEKYLGARERIAKETFSLVSISDVEYAISFAINTYNGEAARMEVTIMTSETIDYDYKFEKLKIALKNRLLSDWNKCTWLIDNQAADLCKKTYEKTYLIENNLRAFASKVLIHFLGVDWIKRAGLEKEAESVEVLKEKFIQRVPEFDNINTDFLSMTLETLAGVMFKGIIYKDDVILDRQAYKFIQELGAKETTKGISISNYVKSQRNQDKKIWEDIFVPYIDNPITFQTAVHKFIENRNHVAHSKVLTWSAYQVILHEFEEMNNLVLEADRKFEQRETSDEVIQTWEYESQIDRYEDDYYRERLTSETGIAVLDENEIGDWFEEILHEIYNAIYQRYHLDVSYDISGFMISDENELIFSVSSSVNKDESVRIDITAEYFIDDNLGEDSTCYITAINGAGEEKCKTEIHFHNGNGYEGEDGFMKVTDNSEYDTFGLQEFYEELIDAIEDLNSRS